MKVTSLWEINKIWIHSDKEIPIFNIDLSIDSAKELAKKLDKAIKDYEATEKGLKEYLSRGFDEEPIKEFGEKV